MIHVTQPSKFVHEASHKYEVCIAMLVHILHEMESPE